MLAAVARLRQITQGELPKASCCVVSHGDRCRYDPERLSICSAAANDDASAIDGLLRQGVSVDSRHRIRTARGWHHERYSPLIAACSQVGASGYSLDGRYEVPRASKALEGLDSQGEGDPGDEVLLARFLLRARPPG